MNTETQNPPTSGPQPSGPPTSGPEQSADAGANQEIVVCPRPSVSFHDHEVAGKRKIVVHEEETGKYFHLGGEEAFFFSMLDGVSTVNEIAANMRNMGVPWSDEELKAFVSVLMKSGIVSVVSVDGKPVPPVNTREQSAPRPMLHRAAAMMGLMLSQRIPLGNADSLAARALPWVRSFLTGSGLLVWTLGIAVAFWIVWEQRSEFATQCRQMFSPASWPALACVGVVVKVVHELGHAVTAKRHGVRVGNVGITLFLFAPLAYADLTNAWKLVGRWPRIQIALGGVYFESWLAIFATFAFAWLDDGMSRHLAAQIMMIAGPATWITNANPLLRLDGYYVISDATNIPNLRMHGRKFWGALIDEFVLRKPVHPCHLVGWRKTFAAVHAAASVIFQFGWMSGLVIAVYFWANAIGAILAAVAFMAWGAMPLVLWWYQNWYADVENEGRRKQTRRRMLSAASFVSLLASIILSARNPLAHGVPVLVQHRHEQISRASTDGFVTTVVVHANEFVSRGDLLMEITDDQLLLRREQMSDDLLVNQAKYRQLQSTGRLADAAAANETVKQLRVSIAELDQSIAAMRITADRAGVVVSDDPQRWLGRHAKKGDVLIRIADPNDKEMLVAVEEGDFTAYNRAVERGRPLPSRIRGGSRVMVEPQAAQPRFSQTLPHPALSALAGGDVPVIPDQSSEDGAKSAVPIGTAIAVIPPTESLTLIAGQRGTLYLEDDQTIYARLKQWLLRDYR